MAGAPSQLDLLDPKPTLQQHDGAADSRGAREGRALRLHQGHAAPARLAVHVRDGRTGGGRGLRAAPALQDHRRRGRGRALGAHHPVQPRPGPDLHEHRPPDRGPAVDGRVAHLRPRQREPGPAGLRGAHLRARTTPTAARAAGAAASCPPSTRGWSSATRATRSSSSPTRPGSRRAARRDSLDVLRALNERRLEDTGDPEIADADRAPTSWPTGCRRACPSWPTSPREPRRGPRALRHRAGQGRPSPTTACWRAGWSSAASASSSSTTAAGTTTAPARATTS